MRNLNQTNDAVTVYTKSDCVQCDATKRTLTKYEIPFSEIDLSANADILDQLKAAEWMRAPIVKAADGKMWSGFRPDRIRELASPKPSWAPSTEWSRLTVPPTLPVRL